MTQQNEKWYRLTIDAVERKLNTNASCGLSRKEARSRYRKNGANRLFDPPQASRFSFLRPIFCDVSILLLLFSLILSFCFADFAVAVPALLCALLGVSYTVYVLRYERKYQNALAACRIPYTTVIRDGKQYSVSARDLVRGDLIALRKGDLVPCDCRLVSLSDLRVSTLYLDEKGKPTYSAFPKSFTMVYAAEQDVPSPLAQNMLYGGSEILDGEAFALVVETSQHCFLGKIRDFHIPAEAQKRRCQKDAVACVSPYLSVYHLLLLILLLPLILIGLLLYQGQFGITRMFLSVCALLGTASQVILLAHFRFAQAKLSYSLLNAKKDGDRITVKTEGALSQLATISDLFLFGVGALSDGKQHLKHIWLGNREPDLNREDEENTVAAYALAEAFLLLHLAKKRNSSFDFGKNAISETVFLEELLQKVAFDREALQMRVRALRFLPREEQSDLTLEVRLSDRNTTLFFSKDPSRIGECDYFEDNGKQRFFEPLARQQLCERMKTRIRDGEMALLVIRKTGSESCFVGAIATGERYQESLLSTLDSISESGVRVTLFFQNVREEVAAYLHPLASMMPDMPICYRQDSSANIMDLYQKHRVLQGFSDQEIVELIGTLQKKGRQVAVCGIDSADIRFMRKAALAISFDSFAYHKQVGGNLSLPSESYGMPDSQQTSSTNRRYADLLIPRADREMGGVVSLLHLLKRARLCQLRMEFLFRFLFLSMISRFTVTLFSFCFGRGLIGGAQLLYSGFYVEAVGALCLLSLPFSTKKLSRPHAFSKMRIEKILTDKSAFSPTLFSSLAVSVYALILSLCGIFSSSEFISFLFVSTVILQLYALVVTVFRALQMLPFQKLLLSFVWILLPILIAVLLSIFFPAVHAVLGLGEWKAVTSLSLILPFLLPIFFFKIFSRK